MFQYKRSKANGYKHRDVAAKMLNRPLSPKEVVHHIDCDPTNNEEDNLMVFSSKSCHTSWHFILKHGIDPTPFFRLVQGVYTYDRAFYMEYLKRSSSKRCFTCGELLSPPQKTFCSMHCSKLGRRKVTRPTKEQLHRLVWSVPRLVLSKQFGVSDTAVKKWARSYKLSMPPRGWWTKIEYGKFEGQTCPLLESEG